MAMKLQIFTIKKIPKLGFNHTCLAVISLDSVLKKDDNYFPRAFLKECKTLVCNTIVYILRVYILNFCIFLMLIYSSFLQLYVLQL